MLLMLASPRSSGVGDTVPDGGDSLRVKDVHLLFCSMAVTVLS